MTHTKHAWAPAPSAGAAFTLANFQNLDNQYVDAKADFGTTQGSKVVASPTSKYKLGASYLCDNDHDEVQIQAAIDDCAAVGGGTVILLEGYFYLGANLRLKDNVNIEGNTYVVVVLNGFNIINNDTTIGNKGITIRHFNIVGGGYGIYLYNCKEMPGITFQNIRFYDTRTELHNCEGVSFGGCSFYNPTAVNGFVIYDCKFIRVTHNNFYNQYIDVQRCIGCIIRGNTVVYGKTSPTNAIVLQWCTGCIIMGNTVNKTASIACPTSIGSFYNTGCIISGNYVTNFNAAGISLIEDTATIIAGNIITGGLVSGGGTGMLIAQYGTNKTNVAINITGNSIHDNYGRGIYSMLTNFSPLQYSIVSCNKVYKNGFHGIDLTGLLLGVVVGNVVRWNSQNAHNTYYGITVGYYSFTGYSIIAANRIHTGDAPPQQYCGICLGTGGNYCLVTINYCYYGGITYEILDYATGTDKTAWMVAGNKLAL